MRVLLLGGSGLVGSRFIELQNDNFEIISPSHDDLDLTQKASIDSYFKNLEVDQVLYAAGYTNVDLAEEQKEEVNRLNVDAPKWISERTKGLSIPFYYLSTDYVFDGTKDDTPYTEEDIPSPVEAVYARSKADGEKIVLENSSNGVIRLIMPFSANYTRKMDLARVLLAKLKNNEKIMAVYDQKVNPIFVDDLVTGIGKILEKSASGIYHVAATDFTTPYDFTQILAQVFELDNVNITKTSFAEFSTTRPAKRPQHTWLDTSKFVSEFGKGILHSVEEEIKMFKEQQKVDS